MGTVAGSALTTTVAAGGSFAGAFFASWRPLITSSRLSGNMTVWRSASTARRRSTSLDWGSSARYVRFDESASEGLACCSGICTVLLHFLQFPRSHNYYIYHYNLKHTTWREDHASKSSPRQHSHPTRVPHPTSTTPQADH